MSIPAIPSFASSRQFKLNQNIQNTSSKRYQFDDTNPTAEIKFPQLAELKSIKHINQRTFAVRNRPSFNNKEKSNEKNYANKNESTADIKSKNGLSSDVKLLLKSMMGTSKLTHRQQLLLDEFVSEKSTLPISKLDIEKKKKISLLQNNLQTFRLTIDDIKRNNKPHLRSLETIKNSGCYNPDINYRPFQQGKNRELQIEEFAKKMSGLENIVISQKEKKQNEKHINEYTVEEEEEIDEITMLKSEILERKNWLEEMKQLGREKEFKSKINQEIESRMSRLKLLHNK
ncbi:hypothetical protein HK099_002295 [Clydaea vesicula]|uniref:Uncharacterized protein n=1 Tax=Clydaea vesicula TaxID=447962 RepID=A0AAD5U4I4_9FUNG|nr:hypothetical protein HK099_002295 [Clydaea vesicula]